jgi:peptide/nickel transport system permease protein
VGRRMIPSLVLLVVIGAYLKTRGVLFEGVFIGPDHVALGGLGGAGADLHLRSREFVDLARRLSGRRAYSIVVRDIAPNMASYLFLVVVVLLFGSSMLLAASTR